MKWVVVVTRTEARIFNETNFELVAHLRSELGRLRNREMSYGKPGVAHGKFGGSTRYYNLTNERNPHEEAANQFAREVTEFLLAQKNRHRFDDLLIVSEPRMKGRLRGYLNKHLKGCTHYYDRDFGWLKPHTIRGVLSRAGLVTAWNPRVTA